MGEGMGEFGRKILDIVVQLLCLLLQNKFLIEYLLLMISSVFKFEI